MKKLFAVILLCVTSATLYGCVVVPEGPYRDTPRRGWHHDSWHEHDERWR